MDSIEKLLKVVFSIWLRRVELLLTLDRCDRIWYKFLERMKEFLILVAGVYLCDSGLSVILK